MCIHTEGPVMQSSFEDEDLIALWRATPLTLCWKTWRSSDVMTTGNDCTVDMAGMCCLPSSSSLFFHLGTQPVGIKFRAGLPTWAGRSANTESAPTICQQCPLLHSQSSVVHLQDQPSEVTIVFILKSDLITTCIFSEVLYLSVTTLVINKYSNCLCPRIDSVTLSKMQKIFYLSIN